jgi:hypothetical protein
MHSDNGKDVYISEEGNAGENFFGELDFMDGSLFHDSSKPPLALLPHSTTYIAAPGPLSPSRKSAAEGVIKRQLEGLRALNNAESRHGAHNKLSWDVKMQTLAGKSKDEAINYMREQNFDLRTTASMNPYRPEHDKHCTYIKVKDCSKCERHSLRDH